MRTSRRGGATYTFPCPHAGHGGRGRRTTCAGEHTARLLRRAPTQHLSEILDRERLIVEPGREVPVGLDERFEDLILVGPDGGAEAGHQRGQVIHGEVGGGERRRGPHPTP